MNIRCTHCSCPREWHKDDGKCTAKDESGPCICRAFRMPEFCICSAIKMPNGEVIYGHRHNHCLDVVRARTDVVREDIIKSEQGFVTSTGRFVDRHEAMAIQKVSGRPSCYGKDGQYVGEILFSEDLY